MSLGRPRFLKSVSLLLGLCVLLAGGFFNPRASSLAQQVTPEQQTELLTQLQTATSGQLAASLAPATGTYNFIRATGKAVLATDSAALAPETRARTFLTVYGPLLGITDQAGQLKLVRVHKDEIGMTHVRFSQVHDGLSVFAGELIVHMNDRGITAVNGTIIPGITVAATPGISEAEAGRQALNAVAKQNPGLALSIARSQPAIYRTGLLEGFFGENHLAYGIEIAGDGVREAVWMDAESGTILNQISLVHKDLNRVVYSPEYNEAFVQRREGDPPSPLAPVNNLYDFSGQTYDLFYNAFGRDSYDGEGATMRTVYLVNEICPNAYWDGVTTNYCPGFDLDDVVAHEWGHAYTEYTHGLIYQYQSGALNESYSDIWGETLDLHNNRDGIGGSNNEQPAPDGQRWLVGEDLGQPTQELLLRDMWNPDRQFAPGKVSSENYFCGTDDGGGVHTNSGVPNHAYAMLCDGAEYNGQTIGRIGFVKATQIYYRAQAEYQVASTNFAAHADALETSCNDLIGQPIKDFQTGEVSSEVISAADCEQVHKAMLAVEMRNAPLQCNYEPILKAGVPALCSNAEVMFSEDWESGMDGWTLTSTAGTTGDAWPNYNWVVTNTLPDGRPGMSAFAIDEKAGSCSAGGDISGHFMMDSREITITADNAVLRFDHWVATEAGYDGGNVKISVNGGEFTAIPAEAYSYNGPNATLDAGPPLGQNTNPMGGQDAWSGTDGGEVDGSWGTTVVDLSTLAGAGDTITLRWEFGVDGCNGIVGWYVDDINVYACQGLNRHWIPVVRNDQ